MRHGCLLDWVERSNGGGKCMDPVPRCPYRLGSPDMGLCISVLGVG